MQRRFDTEEVDSVLAKYKKRPNSVTLAALYESVDPIVSGVTSRIARRFSKKHPDDFLDIQQNVRIAIFNILEKIANMSETGNQIISIIVSATVWSFKTNYRAFKRKTPVSGDSPTSISTWTPEYNVPIEVPYPSTNANNLSYTVTSLSTSTYQHTTLVNVFSTPPSQVEAIYLQHLPELIAKSAKAKNRYKDKQDVVDFCINTIMDGRSPSTSLIANKWDSEFYNFWPKYSKVLIKLSALEVLE